MNAPDPARATGRNGLANATAALAVPALGLLWGLNWPAVRVLLSWWSPWTVRLVGLGAGALLLFALARLRGEPLAVPRSQRLRLVGSALFTIVGFNLCTAFAQTVGSTSRAAIVTFTMPIWAVLMAWAFIGEQPDRRRLISVGLGVLGLTLLAIPLLRSGTSPWGVLLALGAGLSWAAGTVLLKRFPLSMPAVPATAWQLAVSATVCALGGLLGWLLMGDAAGPPAAARWSAFWFGTALVYHIALAMALGYLIWFDVIARLPAGVAALSTLLVPVVGVAGAMLLLGERPSMADLGGFVLILAAAALVLIPPRSRRSS